MTTPPPAAPTSPDSLPDRSTLRHLADAWDDLDTAPLPLTFDATVERTWRLGWTVERVAQMTAYAAHGAEHSTGFAEEPDRGRAGSLAWMVADLLELDSSLTAEQVLAWMAVAVAAPERARRHLFVTPVRRNAFPDAPAASFMDLWEQVVPGGLAPLTFAAGLTMEEAEDALAADGLDRDHLLALALLRGYRFPPGFLADAG